ncbi:MAG: putative non-heme bromoperoxidase BpoC [Pseudomonadota bacterium]|jgi:pimeloyl-ACP methyl ester carboxylesterase
MTESVPTVLVPGLFCSPRLYAEQLPVLWQFGPVTVADHRHDADLGAIVDRLLATAPRQFGLIGLSMGGYVALEVMRRAPERVLKLGLLSTSARPDTPEQTAKRRQQMTQAQSGQFAEVVDAAWPMLVAPAREHDAPLRDVVHAMARDTGAEAFVRQQTAIIGRPDSRPDLPAIRCPALVLAGRDDQVIPPAMAEEMAAAIPGASLVLVPHCGHLSTLEQADDVNAALMSFWSTSYR